MQTGTANPMANNIKKIVENALGHKPTPAQLMKARKYARVNGVTINTVAKLVRKGKVTL